MSNHRTDTCTICLRSGHNAAQCPADKWPRQALVWLVACVACIALSGLPLWMNKP